MKALSRPLESFRIFILTVGFVATNIILYTNYLTPVWGYQGFYEFDPSRSIASLCTAIIYILVFSLAYPPKINRYSRFFVWVLFYFLYIPSSIIVAMQGIPDDGGIMLITCVTISFWLIAFIPEIIIIYRPTTSPASLLHLTEDSSARFKSRYDVPVIALSSLFFLIIFVYYFSVIRVFSLNDTAKIYEQREAAVIYSPNRALMSYAAQWAARVVSPFLIAIGLIFKNRLALIIGLLGFLLVFFISGSKFTFFSVALMFFMYRYVLSKNRFSGFQVGVFFWASLAIPLIAVQFYGNDVHSLLGIILSQILKRAYAVGGMTLGHYYDFFSHNPYTYYSHLGPIGWFVQYPYGDFSIGQMVGHFQAGTYEYNMSANFWSTDGIAAAGYAGIVIIGFVLGSILTVFNRWSKPKYYVLLCLSSLGCVWMLADTSVFRVLLSGGWPLHFLFVYLYSRGIYRVRT